MSWDIFVQDLPRNVETTDDIPHDFKPQPIGTYEEITRRIKEAVPDVEFHGGTWSDNGVINRGGAQIQIGIRQ